MKIDVVNKKVMYGILDKIAQLDNANKTDKYFERIIHQNPHGFEGYESPGCLEITYPNYYWYLDGNISENTENFPVGY